MDKHYLEETKRLIDFISRSPSPFHVVANIEKELLDAGFIKLNESKRFSLERGKSYYVTRNNSSLIAFRIPDEFDGLYSVSAHTDSPSFKIKAKPDVKNEGCPTRLNVEGYGGMLISTWLDRPLSIAGRVFVKEGGEIKEKLVDFCDEHVLIPNLAIHQNRDANNGYKYSVQNELLPIFADYDSSKSFEDVLSEKADVEKESIISYDLFLYNKTNAQIWGVDDAFFSSSKIDDLECAYMALRAIIDAKPKTKISMCALFDNEEVGSGTKQGALSDFLKSTITRIFSSFKIDEEERLMLIANSRAVSADNAHAVHPAHISKSDITNKPKMNGGVVIKYSANQKYTTDGESGAFIKDLMDRNNIPNQYFFNNSDVQGGSTLGNLSTWKVSIRTCDVGAAQLAMHSSYETAGTKDAYNLKSLFKVFLSI